MKMNNKGIVSVLFAGLVMMTSAHADNVGGFVKDHESAKVVTNNFFDVATVAQAKTMRQDAYVILEGYITGSANTLDLKEYLFKDNSGIIKIEVPKKLWQGRKVTSKTKIRILGEIDHNDVTQTVEIEVKKIELVLN